MAIDCKYSLINLLFADLVEQLYGSNGQYHHFHTVTSETPMEQMEHKESEKMLWDERLEFLSCGSKYNSLQEYGMSTR